MFNKNLTFEKQVDFFYPFVMQEYANKHGKVEMEKYQQIIESREQTSAKNDETP